MKKYKDLMDTTLLRYMVEEASRLLKTTNLLVIGIAFKTNALEALQRNFYFTARAINARNAVTRKFN